MSKPTEYTLANALKATTNLKHGRKIQSLVIKFGFCRFTVLMTSLMNFNFKYNNFKEAIKLFDEMPKRDRDVVTWTSLIVGYAQKHCYNESLIGFRRMMMESRINEGVVPNGYAFSAALSACSGIQAVKQGKQIHCHVLTSGLLGSNLVVYNSLLHMYWSCGCNFYAQSLFDWVAMSGDIISWNEMMLGYLQCGQEEEALKLFVLMVSAAVTKPDNYSFGICINACGSLASLQQGSQFHACVFKTGFQSELIILNALVDMYAKCGCLDSAKLVFDGTPSKDKVFWTTMITAFGKNGKVKEVLDMFEQMRNLNIKPDGITYLVVLSACSHGGLVEQGWRYFRSMTEDDLVPVSQKHYACMVDLLCRSGNLLQAFAFIKEMPLNPGISIWSTFLGFCRMQGNIELAQFAAEQLRKLSPEDTGKFVSLSNVYASERNWNETEEIRDLMNNNNVKKEPGCSWIEVNTGLHIFLTTVNSHPEMNEILLTLKGLMTMIRKTCTFE
ncbi:hypothetical protein AQUCO_05100043v1 [Aquilegia coerulea]|uniref:Pentatricopeptide repeat-containing protein n=1 Tax=Aquilegia coerulea TaxID=218851 RepID=A0A2G5CJ91_AQUCA|nr:hypothetical protein AQUCO_05100043v1 [Aquilegia coerulea]